MVMNGETAFSGSFGSVRQILSLLAVAGTVGAAVPFSVKTGLFNQADSTDLGLTAPVGLETITVFKPTASSDHYSNGVVAIGFKGYLYCMWQSSAVDEDAADTWVAYSRSADGKTWSTPAKIAGPGSADYKTSGGWWVNGDTLVAYVNVWPSSLSPEGGFAYYSTSTDGLAWSALKQVAMSDGTAMKGIMEQDPHQIPGGRIVGASHLQPGLLCNPIYTDDRSGIRGWKKAAYTPLTYTGTVTREIEPSLFRRSDSALVMVFRDQNTNYRKLAALSTDRGATWTTAVQTDMPDSRAKQSAGNLPDGTAYQVNNPVEGKRRSPLAIELSKDGKTFDKAFVLRQGGADLQAQKYTGVSKGLGYSYPKSTVWGDHLYVGYATNKEDVQLSKIPLSSIQLVTAAVESRDRSQLQVRVLSDRFLVEKPGAFRCELRNSKGRLVESVWGANRLEIGRGIDAGVYALKVSDGIRAESYLVAKGR